MQSPSCGQIPRYGREHGTQLIHIKVLRHNICMASTARFHSVLYCPGRQRQHGPGYLKGHRIERKH